MSEILTFFEAQKDALAVFFCVLCAIDIVTLYCRYKFNLIPKKEILEDHKTLDLDAIQKEGKTNLATDVSLRLVGISIFMFAMYNKRGYPLALFIGFQYCVYVLIQASRTTKQLVAQLKQNGD